MKTSKPSVPAGPPDPRFQEAMLRIFNGDPMQNAVESGCFALGVIPRDRSAAEQTMVAMEADPAAARAMFSRGQA